MVGLALITAAMVPVYSFPGVAWLVVTAGLWIVAQLLRIRAETGRRAVRGGRPAVAADRDPRAIVLVLVCADAAPEGDRLHQLRARSETSPTRTASSATSSRPLETLGIWPSGDWLLRDPRRHALLDLRGDRAGRGPLRPCLVDRPPRLRGPGGRDLRDLRLPRDEVHRERRPLHPRQGGGGSCLGRDAARGHRAALAGRRLAEAGLRRRLHRAGRRTRHSSRSATRWSRPIHRLHELAAFQDEVARPAGAGADQRPLHGLRPADGGGLEPGVQLRDPGRVCGDRRASACRSTSTPCRPGSSTNSPTRSPPARSTRARRRPGWTLVDSTESYKLWKRTGTTPPIAQPLRGGAARPRLPLQPPKVRRRSRQRAARLLTWQPRRVIAKRLYWKAGGRRRPRRRGVAASKGAPIDNELAPGETASQTIPLPAGQVGALAAVRQPGDRA